MNDIQKKIAEIRVVPVVVLDNADAAVPLAEALVRGNLPLAEITFRTVAAEESIRRIVEKVPEIIVGAGTVTNIGQAKLAKEAGAKFIVTPGFSEEITEYAVENNLPVFPGVCTPTEIMKAMKYGVEIVKFFPAGQYGGLETIKALAAPFPSMMFMPTGGVNANNLKDYLSFPKVVACGGSWMVQSKLIKEGRFEEIERLAREAVDLAKNC